MGRLSSDLKDMGYERTERESPFDEEGTLWSKGYEVVCDQTGIVVRSDGTSFRGERRTDEETVYRYRNSGEVKLPGGYLGKYEWGETEGGFRY